MFFKIDALKSFRNFTGKHLSWSLFLKNLDAEGLQLYQKRLQHRCFSMKFAKFLRTPFLQNPFGDCFFTPGGCFCIFFKKWLNSYFATLLWRTNNFFFSTHHLMHKKSNSFVYKFIFNCQIFKITPSGCVPLWSWKLAFLITWTILFKIPFLRYLSMHL